MDFSTLFILVGITQSTFFGVLLITINSGNRRANRIMGVLMFLFGFSILHTVIFRLDLYAKFPHYLMLGHPIVFLFGPFLLWYVTQSAQPEFRLKPIHTLHLLPFLMFTLYLTPTVFLHSAEYKLQLLQKWNSDGNPLSMFASLLQVIQLFCYLFYIDSKLRNREKRLKNNYSTLQNINLVWIRTIIYLLAAVFLLIVMLLVVHAIFPAMNMLQVSANLIGISVSASIFIVGFFAMRQPKIFTAESKPVAKYSTSPLTNTRATHLAEKLETLMQQHKPFLDNELTLAKLATQLAIPAYQLSQLINEQQNMSFFDYVNMYRVEEAKRLLSDPAQAHFSVLSIGFDSGFNSKSSFNAAFKKHTQLTPSEYRQAHLARANS